MTAVTLNAACRSRAHIGIEEGRGYGLRKYKVQMERDDEIAKVIQNGDRPYI